MHIARMARARNELDAGQLRQLAVEIEADPRSILKALRGGSVRGVIGRRIKRELERRGFFGTSASALAGDFDETSSESGKVTTSSVRQLGPRKRNKSAGEPSAPQQNGDRRGE